MNAPQIVAAVLLLACTTSADHGISARHAYSASSSGSNAFASASAGSGAGAGVIPNPAAFWWAGPNSPFKEAHEYFRRCSQKGDCGNIPGPFPGIPANLPNNVPSNGCNNNGCGFSGSFNVNDKVQNGKDSNFGPIDISKNPFLNGEYKGVAVSSCSGHGCPNGKPHSTITTTECKGTDCKTNTQQGAPGNIGFGDNKFFGGLFTGTGFGNEGGQAPFPSSGGCSTNGCSGNQNFQGPTAGTGCSGVKGGCNGGSSFAGSGSFAGSTAGAGSYYQSGQPGQPGQHGQPSQPGQPGQHGQPGQQGQHGQPSQPGQYGQPEQHGQPGQPGQLGQPEHIGPNDYNKQLPIPTTYPGQLSGNTPTHSTANSYTGSFATSGTKDYSSNSQLGQTTTGQFGNTYGQQPVPTTQPGNFGGIPHNQPSGFPQPENGAACYGQGLICVKKHLCVNGLVNNDGNGLLNVRHGEKYCEPNTEVCCQLPGSSGQPHKDINIQLPNQPGSQSFYTTSSHQNSAASAASSSASSSSSGTTYFTSNLPNTESVPRFSTPEPNKTPQPAFNPGVYQPSKNSYQPGPNQYQPGGSYQPGQTINFGGKDGTSPGVIQVVPDGQTGSRTQAPDLVRPAQNTNVPQTGLTHILPNGQVSNPDGSASTYQPNYAQGSTNPNQLTDVQNELNFASTLQGPAYLPPGPSPSPSPSNYSPDLLPPNRPQYPQQPSSPRPTPQQPYSPTTSKPIYSSTPAPTTYYPTTKFQPPNTSGYLPPYSGSPSQTQGSFVTTKKPQVTNGYLPPNQVPSASGSDNNYLPPPKDRQPDSNIINISVLRPNPDPVVPSKKPINDRDPAPTNPDQTFLRPSSPRTTDFGQNTTPYPGCAAALKCVTEDFCTAEGVISPVQVVLTKEQQTNRVPLTECLDPESGIIGKCCRDPDYKDPWPSTQLGLFNPDQDGAGSNNGPNRQRPNNNGQYRPQQNPGVKGNRRPSNPYEPNQIGSPSNNPNAVIRPGGYPTHVPNIPFDSRLVNVPVPVDVKPPIETDYSQKVVSRTKIAGENCGIRHPDSSPRGPGPIDANFAEIPWQAMILRDTNRSLLCGGAIIRKDVVLTAAHCVENLQSNDVLVKGGEWKLGIDEEPKPFQINKVATIVRHPGYNPQTRLNDIALLILNEKFRSDRNVDTLCLPDPDEDVAKTFQKAKCITTGWGKTILQLNIVNSIMHILGVGIMPASQCQQQLQQYHSDSAYLYNTNCVCGAPVQPQTDICDVDVGSALACDRGDGRYTLAGIYSWDTGCNPTAQIAGYTKVDTHWIESTLQRPIKDLRTEERGFYAQLQAQGSAQECHCLPGK